MKGGTKQNGVALIQVLFISLIISLLALQMTFKARQQVDTAFSLDNRVRAQLLTRSILHTWTFANIVNNYQSSLENDSMINLLPALSAIQPNKPVSLNGAEILVEDIIAQINKVRNIKVEEISTVKENVSFKLPRDLQ